MSDGHRGRIKMAKHQIKLTSSNICPVHSTSYRADRTERKFAAKDIQKMIQEDVIERVNTERASSIVFAPMKDGSFRLCLGYLKPNEVTVKDSYPLRRTYEFIDFLGKDRILPTLVGSGYW